MNEKFSTNVFIQRVLWLILGYLIRPTSGIGFKNLSLRLTSIRCMSLAHVEAARVNTVEDCRP